MATITATGTAVCEELCEDLSFDPVCAGAPYNFGIPNDGGATSITQAAGDGVYNPVTGRWTGTAPALGSGHSVELEFCREEPAQPIEVVASGQFPGSGQVTWPTPPSANCFYVVSVTGAAADSGGAAGFNPGAGWTVEDIFRTAQFQTSWPHLGHGFIDANAVAGTTTDFSAAMPAYESGTWALVCNASAASLGGLNAIWTGAQGGAAQMTSPVGTLPPGGMCIATGAAGTGLPSGPPPGHTLLQVATTPDGWDSLIASSTTNCGGDWVTNNNTNSASGTIILEPLTEAAEVCKTCTFSFETMDCGSTLVCPPTVQPDICITGDPLSMQLPNPNGYTFTMTGGNGFILPGGIWGLGMAPVGSYTVEYQISDGIETIDCIATVEVIDCSVACPPTAQPDLCITGGNLSMQLPNPNGHTFTMTGGAGFILPGGLWGCLLYTSPSPRDQRGSRMPSSA